MRSKFDFFNWSRALLDARRTVRLLSTELRLGRPPNSDARERHCFSYSHLDRHLAVFTDVWLLAGQPRLSELESRGGSARWSVPQFRRERLYPQ
jgi:hypothetical protein